LPATGARWPDAASYAYVVPLNASALGMVIPTYTVPFPTPGAVMLDGAANPPGVVSEWAHNGVQTLGVRRMSPLVVA